MREVSTPNSKVSGGPTTRKVQEDQSEERERERGRGGRKGSKNES